MEVKLNKYIRFIYIALWGYIIVFFCTFCTESKKTYTITGKAPDLKDNTVLYLVPIENATKETADSTYIVNGTFEFKGEIEKEEVKIIRTKSHLSFRFQPVLVVIEPGEIKVVLDSVSIAGNTLQNELLQTWKNVKQDFDKDIEMQKKQLRNSEETFKQEIRERIGALSEKYATYNYEFIKQHQHTTVGQFVYKMVGNSLTEEQKESLKLIEKEQ